MYTATCSFYTRRGNPVNKGQEIGRVAYLLLYPEDKAKFVKTKDISKEKEKTVEIRAYNRPLQSYSTPRPSSSSSSGSHYGYGPEPGYEERVYPTSNYIAHESYDDTPSHSYNHSHSHHDSHSHDSHSSYDSGSYDSGSSSSDSSSCDSGGGDCGGGCDGG